MLNYRQLFVYLRFLLYLCIVIRKQDGMGTQQVFQTNFLSNFLKLLQLCQSSTA